MAMTVAEASMQLLEVSRVKVRAIHREADAREGLLALWESACSWEGTASSRLLGADGAGDEAVAAKAARALAAALAMRTPPVPARASRREIMNAALRQGEIGIVNILRTCVC